MDEKTQTIRVNRVDIAARRIHAAELSWSKGRITAVRDLGAAQRHMGFLLPGFIDAHVHIESSMLPPAEFGRLAARHGTVACLSDPHEIANVLGVKGLRFMLKNAQDSGFKVFFGAPSCVPATGFETAGAVFGTAATAALLDLPGIYYLSEMMNFPAVLAADPQVLAKLELASRRGLPVDGHAPGLVGQAARDYAAAGISTDHECSSLAEARDKIAAGMHILIREGSAARDFDALHSLIATHPGRVMFCSDDKHADDLVAGHIDRLVARALAAGHDLFDTLRCACLNPVKHYRLPMGRLNVGDPMDAVEVDDLSRFFPRHTWIDGRLAAAEGKSLLPRVPASPINCFHARPVLAAEISIPAAGAVVRVIEARDGSLFTTQLLLPPLVQDNMVLPDPGRDMLLLLVHNRYQPAAPTLALVRGFGLRRGALAASVAHDSHNIVAVAADSRSLLAAVNALVESRGGLALAEGDRLQTLPLPVAGLMSLNDGDQVAAAYTSLNRAAAGLGSPLRAPFMTLSFMALLVIPELKLSDRGLFDGRGFRFTGLFP